MGSNPASPTISITLKVLVFRAFFVFGSDDAFPLDSVKICRIPKNGAFLATDLATILGFLSNFIADIFGAAAKTTTHEQIVKKK